MVFVGFDVALFLIEADVEPLSAGLNFMGGPGCGHQPGLRRGRVWLRRGAERVRRLRRSLRRWRLDRHGVHTDIPASDFADSDTLIAMNFSGDRLTFELDQ